MDYRLVKDSVKNSVGFEARCLVWYSVSDLISNPFRYSPKDSIWDCATGFITRLVIENYKLEG